MKKHRKSKLFLEELRNTPVVSAVCKQLGLSRQTIFRWIKEDLDFKKEYEECMTQGIGNVNDLATSQTINKIKQGDSGMIKYWLSHNDDRFMKKPKNNMVDIDFFNSSQERRVDFLDIGESMLMKKILEGDLNAIIFALRHNSGRYHPMKPESPFLDMTDLSDPAVKNIVTEQLNSLSEKINEINAQFSNEDEDA
jgi:hypothetical protein